MDPAAQRAALAALIEERGESFATLSRVLGRNPAYFQQYLKRGSPRLLAEEDRGRIARFFGVSDARLGGPDAGGELVRVAALDIGASAGPGRLVEREQARARSFDPAVLRALGVRAEAASLIRVEGESMQPGLADGDEILVDCDRRRIDLRGGIYVLRLDGAVSVKRLRAVGGGVEVASDNPAFPPPAIREAGEVEVIGRVVWLARALV